MSTPITIGRVLVVDDEVELASVLCKMLAKQHYEAVGFSSPVEALAALKEQNFDLLITDLMMPEMDGIALLKAGLEFDPNLVGLIMTGQGAIPTAVEAMKVGAFDYVLKPFKAGVLLPVLSRAMDVRRLRLDNLHLRETMAIYELSQALAHTLDLNTVLNKVVDGALQQCRADEASIMLPTPDGQELYVAVVRGEERRYILGEHVPVQGGVAGWVARHRQAVTLDGAVSDLRFAPIHPRPDVLSAISMPLIAGNTVVGVLNVNATQRRRPFTLGQMKALGILANIAASTLESAQLYAQARASEEKYRTLVENATEFIWALDTEGRYTFVNRPAEEASGIKAAEWIGRSFAPLIAPPEDLPRIQQIFVETLNGKAQSYEVGVYRPDAGVSYLSVNTTPLYRDGQVVGTISFGRDVTAQRETEAALQQRMAELTALFSLTSTLREARTLEEMLPIILRSTCQVMQCDQGMLSLVDREHDQVVVRVTTPRLESLVGLRTGIGEGISGRVVQTGRPMLPADLANLRAPEMVRRLIGEPRTALCYPLKTAAEVVGTLHLSAPRPREFSESELKLLHALTDMAANAIHRAGLFEQLEHRVHELATLSEVGKMVTATLHIEDVLKFIIGAATQTVQAEGCYLFLWDEREERLVLRASVGFLVENVGRMKYRLGEGLCGWVFLESQTANVPGLAADPRWKHDPEHEAPLPSGRAINALAVPLAVGKKSLGVLGVVNKIGAPAFSASEEALLTTLAGQVAIAIENARLYEDVRGLSIAAIRSLATAIDARDPYTRGHSEGVTHLAVQLARERGWSGADLEMLEFAALLHDVGKIAVPDAVLRKTEPLTPDEWNVIRLHPFYSAQIVKPIEPLQRIVPWVYHHQERWDGTGYPDGLKGEAIPPAARIIAVVDAFNAMTTDRPYRRALSVEAARAEIERGAGGQFDPQLAEAFLRLMDEK